MSTLCFLLSFGFGFQMGDRQGPSSNHEQVEAGLAAPKAHLHSILIGVRGLPACPLKPLQLIQNAAARLVFNQPKFSHVTPLLRSLHWLPVAARTEYKTLMLVFKASKGLAPPYLQSLIEAKKPSGYALRSANTGLLEEPSLKTPGQKSTRPKQFALLAPKLWNKLPVALRTTDSLPRFRRDLKTHLFTHHFSP